MKTTIKELSYLLMDMVNGGLPSDDSKINYRVAKTYIKLAVAEGLRRGWFEDKNNSEQHYVGSTVSKEVDVVFDNEKKSAFVETLGESNSLDGARAYNISDPHINSMWSRTFVPITLNQRFSQSKLVPIPNTVQYYEMDGKLYFRGGTVCKGDKLVLTQRNVVPSNDDDSLPSWVGRTALNEAYRLAYAEIAINSDRINDGVPNN